MKKRAKGLLVAAIILMFGVFTGCGRVQAPDSHPDAQPDHKNNYSEALNTVLMDSYYTGLIEQYKQNAVTYFSDPYFYAAPYDFLEKKGHNVTAIKNGQLECKVSVYREQADKNKLYLSVLAENSHSTDNYYTNYLLTYNLTEKEYNDLYMLYEGNYAQTPLFVQELTKQKTASVLFSFDIEKASYNKLLTEMNLYYTEPLSTNEAEIDVTFV